MGKYVNSDKLGELFVIQLAESLDCSYKTKLIVNAKHERNRVRIFANNLKDIESIKKITLEFASLDWFDDVGVYYLPFYEAVGGKIVDEGETPHTTVPKAWERITTIYLTEGYTFDDISEILEELEIYYNKDEIYDMINIVETGNYYSTEYNY